MKKTLWIFGLILIVSSLLLCAYGWTYTKQQGLTDLDLSSYSKAKIHRDPRGVFQIDASNWLAAVEAQGFSVAGERFFQMDLMRRKADGALAELFGPTALEYDRQQRREDWRYYAELSYQSLPEAQRKTCDAYVRGVNSFLTGYPNQVGIEYAILRTTPAPWTCVDSQLIALLMADMMSHSWERDLKMKAWHDTLPAEWWSYIFPLQHPWSQPLFEDPIPAQIKELAAVAPLPKTQLTPNDFKIGASTDLRNLDGSNSWAYRGKNGAWLANDPHLGYQVPQLWIPMRLSTIDGWWVTGTALPGIPGVLLGMNQHLAWSITNTAEDVDDAVIELDPIYNSTAPEKSESTLTSSQQEIKVKGQASELLTVQKSPRGPIVKDLGQGRFVARQWLALKPGLLSLPLEALAHATQWESFNAALDEFKFVPLNFTMLDQVGNMGLRISGCDIKRQNDGAFAEEATSSNWDPVCGYANRRRLFYAFDNGAESAFISTANQQLWRDDHLNNWSDDDRAMRIRTVLSQSNELKQEDMRLLQLDTKSRFHKMLLDWLLKNGRTSYLPSVQKEQWATWDGDSKTCSLCMSEADDGFLIFDQIILHTVAQAFNKSGDALPSVRREMSRARVLKALESPAAIAALGLDSKELATGILQSLARLDARQTKPWHERNHSVAQHPFVNRVPLLGNLFKIGEPAQFGSSATVRSERPNHGPSTRLLWQPSNPDSSLWAFPTGTSGHVLSPFFNNWSKYWQSGAMSIVPIAN